MRRAAARVLAVTLAMLSLVSLGGCTPLTVLAVLDGCNETDGGNHSASSGTAVYGGVGNAPTNTRNFSWMCDTVLHVCEPGDFGAPMVSNQGTYQCYWYWLARSYLVHGDVTNPHIMYGGQLAQHVKGDPAWVVSDEPVPGAGISFWGVSADGRSQNHVAFVEKVMKDPDGWKIQISEGNWEYFDGQADGAWESYNGTRTFTRSQYRAAAGAGFFWMKHWDMEGDAAGGADDDSSSTTDEERDGSGDDETPAGRTETETTPAVTDTTDTTDTEDTADSGDPLDAVWTCHGSSSSGSNRPTVDTDVRYEGDGTHASPDEAKRIAREMMGQYKSWDEDDWTCLERLWTRESGWQWNAENPDSGAYGIPQSLPADKMADFGDDWRDNAVTQIKWGLWYIEHRYGSPSEAWAHSESEGWY